LDWMDFSTWPCRDPSALTKDPACSGLSCSVRPFLRLMPVLRVFDWTLARLSVDVTPACGAEAYSNETDPCRHGIWLLKSDACLNFRSSRIWTVLSPLAFAQTSIPGLVLSITISVHRHPARAMASSIGKGLGALSLAEARETQSLCLPLRSHLSRASSFIDKLQSVNVCIPSLQPIKFFKKAHI
jgi:hypothetical protein